MAGTAIDASAYDALIAAGPVADDKDIEASSWASAVKKAGKLRVGGTRTSQLFSQLTTHKSAAAAEFSTDSYDVAFHYLSPPPLLYSIG